MTNNRDETPSSQKNARYGISIEADLDPSALQNIIVRGRFCILCGEHGVPEQVLQSLKHVILVVTRTGSHDALAPFTEVVVFDDDVKVEGEGTCSASFTLNVMDHIAFDGAGDYYILCSIGTHLSNIVKVTVVQRATT